MEMTISISAHHRDSRMLKNYDCKLLKRGLTREAATITEQA